MPIFFSLDPRVFAHYKTCTIQNGSTIYSNHSIPNDCSCVAPIPADPDFGGPGVIASFCFLAWLTIFFATIPAFYSIRERWRRSKPPWRLWKFLGAILSTNIHEDNPRDQPGSNREARAESSPTVSSLDGGVDEKSEDVQLPADAAEEPRPVRIANALLASLTDIQTFTGIAVVISAFTQIHRITYYHEQFAVNLWWLTLNSLWVSRIDYNEDSPVMGTWRIQVRRLAILVSVIMSAVLQLWVAIRENSGWNPLDGRRCYVGSALGNNFGQNVFWFAGASLYAFVLALGIFKSTRRWVHEKIFEKMPGTLAALRARLKESYRIFRHHEDVTPMQKVADMIGVAGNFLIFVSWWCIVQFLSIWSAGNTAHALELIVYTVFAGSNTWWVIALKVDNVHLVQGDESKWTLGQSLPIALSGLVLFAAFDAL